MALFTAFIAEDPMGKTISTLGSLRLVVAFQSSCAKPDPHPMEMAHAVQTATAGSDHLSLARPVEAAAPTAEARWADHQRLRAQYRAKRFLYGKRIYQLEEHCDVLIRSDRQSADANRKLAEVHRQLAEASTTSP
jgi:hypothetical protein